MDRPTIQIHDLVCPDVPEEDDMDVSGEVSDIPEAVLRPPPGFEQFSWSTSVRQGGDPAAKMVSWGMGWTILCSAIAADFPNPECYTG